MNRDSAPIAVVMLLVIAAGAAAALADPPSTFDLRDVGGVNYVTSVKYQQGGTCWTHGAMASIEGNLLMTGTWAAAGETGEPNLAEYHLDWWNGFNEHNNDDLNPPSGSGLEVHEGGDYRVTAAYLSRGEGAVRDTDGQSFSDPPARWDASYHYYYVRDIEWYTALPDLSRMDLIKEKVMAHGVTGTCMAYDSAFISNYVHYQPPSSSMLPNHAVAIVGWDDNQATQAPQPGAWLCKNSWGAGWGYDGYFWISYYDKWCCQEPEMGAVSLYNVEPMQYQTVHYHDYHGWRDTLPGISEVFNAFIAGEHEVLSAVSFFTAADNVTYTVRVYDDFTGTQLLNELSSKSGFIDHTGFHTIDLDTLVELNAGNDFYLYLQLNTGGQPIDRTSDVPVLLGARYRTIVESTASAGESYYHSGAHWLDLYNHTFTDPTWNQTANFCIKGLAVEYRALRVELPNGAPRVLAPGVPHTFVVEIQDEMQSYVPGTGMLHYRYDGGVYQSVPLTPLGDGLYEAVLPPAACDDVPEFYVSAQGNGGVTVTAPADAPTSVYRAYVGTTTTIFFDSFDTDQNWTATDIDASSGYWQRGIPVNDPAWDYDPVADSDGNGWCYLTQNETGNTDVDDGSVLLTSPVIDMSMGGIIISYDYYLYLTNTTGGVDRLLVEINNNGGMGTWHEIARHTTNGDLNWRSHVITQDDLIAAGVNVTSMMQLRFTANDADTQSIVEAGVDAVLVTGTHCEAPPTCAGDSNCDNTVSWRDIDYFVAAMNDNVAAWEALFAPGTPSCTFENNDANGDGAVNWHDIDPLVALMNTTCP